MNGKIPPADEGRELQPMGESKKDQVGHSDFPPYTANDLTKKKSAQKINRQVPSQVIDPAAPAPFKHKVQVGFEKFRHLIQSIFNRFFGKKSTISTEQKEIESSFVILNTFFSNSQGKYDKKAIQKAFDTIFQSSSNFKKDMEKEGGEAYLNKLESLFHHTTVLLEKIKDMKISIPSDFEMIFQKAAIRKNKIETLRNEVFSKHFRSSAETLRSRFEVIKSEYNSLPDQFSNKPNELLDFYKSLNDSTQIYSVESPAFKHLSNFKNKENEKLNNLKIDFKNEFDEKISTSKDEIKNKINESLPNDLILQIGEKHKELELNKKLNNFQDKMDDFSKKKNTRITRIDEQIESKQLNIHSLKIKLSNSKTSKANEVKTLEELKRKIQNEKQGAAKKIDEDWKVGKKKISTSLKENKEEKLREIETFKNLIINKKETDNIKKKEINEKLKKEEEKWSAEENRIKSQIKQVEDDISSGPEINTMKSQLNNDLENLGKKGEEKLKLQREIDVDEAVVVKMKEKSTDLSHPALELTEDEKKIFNALNKKKAAIEKKESELAGAKLELTKVFSSLSEKTEEAISEKKEPEGGLVGKFRGLAESAKQKAKETYESAKETFETTQQKRLAEKISQLDIDLETLKKNFDEDLQEIQKSREEKLQKLNGLDSEIITLEKAFQEASQKIETHKSELQKKLPALRTELENLPRNKTVGIKMVKEAVDKEIADVEKNFEEFKKTQNEMIVKLNANISSFEKEKRAEIESKENGLEQEKNQISAEIDRRYLNQLSNLESGINNFSSDSDASNVKIESLEKEVEVLKNEKNKLKEYEKELTTQFKNALDEPKFEILISQLVKLEVVHRALNAFIDDPSQEIESVINTEKVKPLEESIEPILTSIIGRLPNDLKSKATKAMKVW